ncbi:DUF1156 domain-containing protein [Thermodesulfobacterium sp. TA1]|uniref:DUF1156 domain-containing protein n=1 Tax=Thermodesulfobacterium sp. TA1 TaxID=2234087 RepID=UPI0012321EAF|nr:DUF1156 domain-containing protein [Thermodesulfobacterium sp. TA1]QER42816.1 DUF1156 domain-containing protein [Thermodesulfobacterium sp. TA1]
MSEKKSFIEVCFPIKEVSEESAREKNIRHGHISTLHIWWARRPLASSRATAYASLIPVPESASEIQRKKEFIIQLSKWENSLNEKLIKQAREDILKANGGRPLKVLDPFAGGGSIPLECLRLGMETHAVEYNPVAVLILKCTLEYPQKYGRLRKNRENEGLFKAEKEESSLIADVKRWGEWVLKLAKEEIGKFYPPDEDGSIPVGYIWARTISCQNPSCGAEIPLMRQFWLAKKENKKISLFPYVFDNRVEFAIIQHDGKAWKIIESSIPNFKPNIPYDFKLEKGTVARAIAECPVCGSIVDDNKVRKLFQEGKAGQRMVAVVLHHPHRPGKTYRLATQRDLKAFKEAERYLEEKRAKLMDEWGIDPVPDEPITRVPVTFGVINVWVYGMLKWGDLFNSRQKLALITFTEKVRLAYNKMIEEGYDKEYAKAVVSYLAITVSRMADFETSMAAWHPQWEFSTHIFTRQALPMNWDYSELNPFSPILTGTWKSMSGQIQEVLSHLTQIPPVEV